MRLGGLCSPRTQTTTWLSLGAAGERERHPCCHRAGGITTTIIIIVLVSLLVVVVIVVDVVLNVITVFWACLGQNSFHKSVAAITHRTHWDESYGGRVSILHCKKICCLVYYPGLNRAVRRTFMALRCRCYSHCRGQQGGNKGVIVVIFVEWGGRKDDHSHQQQRQGRMTKMATT